MMNREEVLETHTLPYFYHFILMVMTQTKSIIKATDIFMVQNITKWNIVLNIHCHFLSLLNTW